MQGFADSAVHALEGRYFRPPLPDGHVQRPRLCERLRTGLSARLLLVCAPAGFGKSSLAVEFCQSLPSSVWLGLSARDSDPARFLERLLGGLQQFFPRLGIQAMSLLKMRQRNEPFSFEEWLDGVLDELAMHLMLSRPLLLVIDDYHLAQGPIIDRCLQMLLHHGPAGLVLLVTSRQRPDWHLARLRLSGQLVELNEHDLRLTDTESLALFGSHGLPMENDVLQDLIRRSEGWVAGLRFGLLAASETGDGRRALHEGQGLIRDYLLEEVIECLPVNVQAFLYETACFERFCGELCDAARGATDSGDILAYLLAHQVFLVPLDQDGRWFRYHHLFSDLLRARLPGPARVTCLHLNACRWLSAQGLLDEAVEQALLAGHLEVAANLVQNLSEEQLLSEQNVGMLLRWKMDLPDSLLTSTPRLIVLYAWALALACQLDAAEELGSHLSRFLPAPSASAQKSMLAQWLALSGVIARGRGDSDRTRRCCGEALLSLPEKRYGQRLVCLSTLANLAVAQGDLLQARALSRDALELAQRVGNPLFEALAHYDRARVLQARGQVTRALEEVGQGLERLKGLPASRLYAVRARLTLYEGYLLSLRMQTDTARVRLHAGLAEARACRDISVLIGHCVLAGLEGQAGRYAEAFAELAEAERMMHMWGVPPVYYLAMVTLFKCELWLLQGRVDLAETWLLRLNQAYGGELSTAAPECHPQLLQHIELQRAALERLRGDWLAGDDRLQRLERWAQEAGAVLPSLFALVQLTELSVENARCDKAGEFLKRSLGAAAGGTLSAFKTLLDRHPEWCRDQLQRAAPCPVRDALLEALPAPVAQVPVPGGDTLSVRELGVLRLIAQGCSNQEISEQLFISLHTVKSHASHINSKLGVERRTQAVARAKALGLL
jgi:LuxR family maltose regulon positive regulatory protein